MEPSRGSAAHRVLLGRFPKDLPLKQLIDGFSRSRPREAGFGDDIGKRQRHLADMHVIEDRHHSDLLQSRLRCLIDTRMLHDQT